jgi:hypothetical protein
MKLSNVYLCVTQYTAQQVFWTQEIQRKEILLPAECIGEITFHQYIIQSMVSM